MARLGGKICRVVHPGDDLALGQLGAPARRGISERLRAADAGPRNRGPDTPRSARALHRVSGPVRPLHLAPKEGCRAWLLAPHVAPRSPLLAPSSAFYSLLGRWLLLSQPPPRVTRGDRPPFERVGPLCLLANLFFRANLELAVVRGPNWTIRRNLTADCPRG